MTAGWRLPYLWTRMRQFFFFLLLSLLSAFFILLFFFPSSSSLFLFLFAFFFAGCVWEFSGRQKMRVRGGIEGQSLKHPTHKSREHIPPPPIQWLQTITERKRERTIQWMDETQLMASWLRWPHLCVLYHIKAILFSQWTSRKKKKE